MIYIVAVKDTRVTAYDGKHWNSIDRLFGTPKEKIAQAILSIYLRVFRASDDLPMGGFGEYYIVAVKDAPLIRAVAKVCIDSKDRYKQIDETIDNFSKEIVGNLVIMAYTRKYEEVPTILGQIKSKGTGEKLFEPQEEQIELPF